MTAPGNPEPAVPHTPPSSAVKMKHPRGLSTLFFTEAWERMSYYGMRGILVLALVDTVAHHGLGLSDVTATAIYGLYTAGVYLLAMAGGWIADYVMGARRTVFWVAASSLRVISPWPFPPKASASTSACC